MCEFVNLPNATPTIDINQISERGNYRGIIKPFREHWLSHLANKHQWSRGAELGVWKGRTFLHLLKRCPKLTMIGVDLWAPQPTNNGPENYVDWNHAEFEKNVRKQSEQYGGRAIIYKMSTLEAAEHVADESLDFVFIDADHSSEAVRNDITVWSSKVKPSGMILGHDINWPTVKIVIDELCPSYEVGPDNVWATWKDRARGWG